MIKDYVIIKFVGAHTLPYLQWYMVPFSFAYFKFYNMVVSGVELILCSIDEDDDDDNKQC